MPLKVADYLAIAARPHLALLTGEVLFHERAEGMGGTLDPDPLLGCRIVAKLHLGMEFGGDLSRATSFNGRRLADD